MSKKDLEDLVDKIEKVRLLLYEKIRDGNGINDAIVNTKVIHMTE